LLACLNSRNGTVSRINGISLDNAFNYPGFLSNISQPLVDAPRYALLLLSLILISNKGGVSALSKDLSPRMLNSLRIVMRSEGTD